MSNDTEVAAPAASDRCKRTDDEINHLTGQAAEYAGMTVNGPGSLALKCRAEGVAAAVAWLLGPSDADPLDD